MIPDKGARNLRLPRTVEHLVRQRGLEDDRRIAHEDGRRQEEEGEERRVPELVELASS